MVLDLFGGFAFFIDVVGSSPPALGPELREEGAEREVFLGWYAVSYSFSGLLIWRRSFGVVGIGHAETVMKESINMKSVKPPLEGIGLANLTVT